MLRTAVFAFSLIVACFSFSGLFAQNNEHHHANKCGHTLLEDWQESRDPNYRERKLRSRENFENQLREFENQAQFRTQSTLKIPVVVHIMHAPGEAVGTQSNISEAQILSQIVVLNEDFRKIVGSRGFNSDPAGADAEIEFCLATRDPSGNPTSGINRVSYVNSNNHNFGFDQSMKALSIWPTNRYLNIWVVKNMSGILGYAYLPEDMATDPQRAQIDGVVVGCRFFGSRDKQLAGQSFNLDNTFGLGRTTTHEVGHYLNLLHTWGDGGCEADDEVFDTPNCSGQYFGCGTAPVQCGNTRMIANYMDYSDDVCMNIYTNGQKTRMRSALTVYTFRASLYSPNNILLTGCTDSLVLPFADTLYIINGNNQLVRINQNLNTNLQIRVVNQLGGGFSGHPVRFQLLEQPGSEIFLDSVISTNSNGTISLPFRTGYLPGNYKIRVSSSVNRGGEVDFNITAISASSVYPNPFEDEVIIKLDLPAEETLEVQVFDPAGRQVLNKAETAQASFVLDMRGFPEGAYTVRVISTQLIDIFRIVKIKP